MMVGASSNQATKQLNNLATKQPSIGSFCSPRHLAVLVLFVGHISRSRPSSVKLSSYPRYDNYQLETARKLSTNTSNYQSEIERSVSQERVRGQSVSKDVTRRRKSSVFGEAPVTLVTDQLSGTGSKLSPI